MSLQACEILVLPPVTGGYQLSEVSQLTQLGFASVGGGGLCRWW